MKQVKGWWFGTTGKKLLHDDNRKIIIGKTHKIKGEIIPCKHALHLSKRLIDALNYASGPVVYRVVGSGIIIPHGNPVDKYACSERTYIAGGIDVSDLLLLFARRCALDVIHLWDAPDVVIRYLKTGDESIKAIAWSTSWAVGDVGDDSWAARAATAARATAWTISWAVGDVWAAVEAAAEASGTIMGDARTAGDTQNRRLTSMISRAIRRLP